MNHSNTFPKSEHLCGETRIEQLFTKGKAFIAYPLRVVYSIQPNNNSEPISVLVSVPKKRFKRAVKRNRLKRLMRESYRLNKHATIDMLIENNLQLQLAFNYISDEELDFITIEKKMKVALKRIQEIIKPPLAE